MIEEKSSVPNQPAQRIRENGMADKKTVGRIWSETFEGQNAPGIQMRTTECKHAGILFERGWVSVSSFQVP